MDSVDGRGLSKVPQITLGFWIIKIAVTTLGATGGDFPDKPVGQGRPRLEPSAGLGGARHLHHRVPLPDSAAAAALEDEPARG